MFVGPHHCYQNGPPLAPCAIFAQCRPYAVINKQLAFPFLTKKSGSEGSLSPCSTRTAPLCRQTMEHA